MTLLDIKKGLNSLLAGEMLSMDMVKQHFNFAVDDVNSALNANLPVLDDVSDLTVAYTAIPDRYIRMCILPGAAHHYYMVDDEGTTPEQDFARQYEAGKFFMLRDWSCSIPEQYQVADNDDGSFAGTVESTYEDYKGTRGIFKPDNGGMTLLGGFPIW